MFRQTFWTLRRLAYHFGSFRSASHACQRTDSAQPSAEGFSSAERSVDSPAFAVVAFEALDCGNDLEEWQETDLCLLKICLCRCAISLAPVFCALCICAEDIVEEAEPIEEECASRAFIGNLRSWQIIRYKCQFVFGICIHCVLVDAIDLSIFSTSTRT